MNPRSDRRMDVDEAGEWWALASRILGFFFGVAWLFTQTDGDQDWKIVAAKCLVGLAAMGPFISASAAQMISAWRRGTE